ncbi:hypothetical protein HK097_006682, partial [Rhizophlyctis rosea]
MVGQGFQPTLEIFELLVTILTRRRMWRRSWEVITEMERFGVPMSIRVINSLLTVKILEEGVEDKSARRWFEGMLKKHGVQADTASITIFLRHAVKHCGRDEFERVEGLVEGVLSDLSIKKDFILYDLVIRFYANNGYLNLAMKKFDEMRMEGIKPWPNIFGDLLGAFLVRDELEGVEMVLELMRMFDLEPDRFMYARLMDAYTKAGDLEGAQRCFEMMRLQADEGVAFEEAIERTVGVGFDRRRDDDGRDLPPRERRKKPRVRYDEALLRRLLTGLRDSGARAEEVLEVYGRMGKRTKTRLDAAGYAQLLRICAEEGEYEIMQGVWRDM